MYTGHAGISCRTFLSVWSIGSVPEAETHLREALQDYFRDAPQVYVAGNMLLYYAEGNPTACVAPDVFVVQGVAKRERRTYRLWEEGQPPTVVVEITSRGTRVLAVR